MQEIWIENKYLNTKVIGLTKIAGQWQVSICLEGRMLNQVGSLKYLGSIMFEDGKK